MLLIQKGPGHSCSVGSGIVLKRLQVGALPQEWHKYSLRHCQDFCSIRYPPRTLSLMDMQEQLRDARTHPGLAGSTGDSVVHILGFCALMPLA